MAHNDQPSSPRCHQVCAHGLRVPQSVDHWRGQQKHHHVQGDPRHGRGHGHPGQQEGLTDPGGQAGPCCGEDCRYSHQHEKIKGNAPQLPCLHSSRKAPGQRTGLPQHRCERGPQGQRTKHRIGRAHPQAPGPRGEQTQHPHLQQELGDVLHQDPQEQGVLRPGQYLGELIFLTVNLLVSGNGTQSGRAPPPGLRLGVVLRRHSLIVHRILPKLLYPFACKDQGWEHRGHGQQQEQRPQKGYHDHKGRHDTWCPPPGQDLPHVPHSSGENVPRVDQPDKTQRSQGEDHNIHPHQGLQNLILGLLG
mmetsp:Transcript_110971/g.254365  ORF Transcript_110971/g.254365 Transcript_110971/m.254365 type:complete len:305 (+) Transcript_110971:675-1589(+)